MKGELERKSKWQVTLVLTTEYGDPFKWDWDALIGTGAEKERLLEIETEEL